MDAMPGDSRAQSASSNPVTRSTYEGPGQGRSPQPGPLCHLRLAGGFDRQPRRRRGSPSRLHAHRSGRHTASRLRLGAHPVPRGMASSGALQPAPRHPGQRRAGGCEPLPELRRGPVARPRHRAGHACSRLRAPGLRCRPGQWVKGPLSLVYDSLSEIAEYAFEPVPVVPDVEPFSMWTMPDRVLSSQSFVSTMRSARPSRV